MHSRTEGLAFLAVFFGAGLLINCTRALFSGEDNYDAESSRISFFSNILGAVAGLLAAAWGIRFLLRSFG